MSDQGNATCLHLRLRQDIMPTAVADEHAAKEGGRSEVTSERGTGTTFIVWIPLIPLTEQQRSTAHRQPARRHEAVDEQLERNDGDEVRPRNHHPCQINPENSEHHSLCCRTYSSLPGPNSSRRMASGLNGGGLKHLRIRGYPPLREAATSSFTPAPPNDRWTPPKTAAPARQSRPS